MALTPEDKQWIEERLEAMETRLLTAFHGRPSPRGALKGLDIRMKLLEDRVTKLEQAE